MIGPLVLALEGVDAEDCLAAIERPDDLALAITATMPDRWQAIDAALDLVGGSEVIVLHEANRPLLSPAGIASLLHESDGADATLPATPVHGTIKRVAGGRIVDTVSRDSLHAAQTPWVFPRVVLAQALRRAITERWAPDDELQFARMAGIRVRMAGGLPLNVPIVSPADARFAEMATEAESGSSASMVRVERRPASRPRRSETMSERAGHSDMESSDRTRTGVAVIVVAAGRGERMSSPTNKIFLPVGGRPILNRTLGLFESMPIIDAIVLVCGDVDLIACEALVRDGQFRKVRQVVTGGASRHASESRGLLSLQADVDAGRIDTILVHDAVRPFIATEQVEALVAESRASGAAILAIPVVDTLVTVADDGTVVDGGDDLWVAQTPQAFRATLVLDAHRRAADQGFVGTDTSSVVERTGHPVAVVMGHPENIKITTSDDLLRAEFIAEQTSGGARLTRLGTLTPRV